MKILEIGELNIGFDEGKILNAISSIGVFRDFDEDFCYELQMSYVSMNNY